MNVLTDIIKDTVKVGDNHPAIITSNTSISYNQLKNKIQSTAVHLSSAGIKYNTKVAILGSNNIEFVVNLLALWNLNACAIPLNVILSDKEMSEITGISDAEILLFSYDQKRNLSVKIPQRPLTLPTIEREEEGNTGTDTDKISLIMYTSGATGKPKGVMHSLNDLLNSADNSQDLLHQTANDKWLASLPFYHIGGMSVIIRAFRWGSTLIIPDSLKNTDLKNSFDHLHPTLASLVSTQLKRLLESNWSPGKELRNILIGGGFSDESLIKEASARGCKISNVYGSTETSAFITANNAEGVILKPLTVGKAIEGNKISIVDDEMKQCPTGTPGEIVVEGNSIFHGYYKEEKATQLKLKDGKFYTGDIGYIDNDGDLFIEARRTDLIISGGENVNPVEVENMLNDIPGIIESCVFGLPDKEWGQIVAAAVVMDKNISLDELGELLRNKISGYKVPRRFFPIEKIPKTSLGKIMREKIKDEIEIQLNLRA